MLRRTCFFFALVLIGFIAASALAQDAAPAEPPTTAPSTAPAGSRSLYDQFLQTEIAKIMQGQTELDWSNIRRVDFWYAVMYDLAMTLVAFVPRLIGTIIFLLVFWIFYRALRRAVSGRMNRSDVDSSIRDLLGGLLKWTAIGFALLIACNQLGIPIVPMLTGVSIIGLAVGFAAQETLANFIAGIVIFLDKPFKIGDWIEVDGTFGQVKRVTFRSTSILSLDGETNIFPNTYVLSNKVVNHTTNPVNRVNIPIGIAYKESIDDARKALLELSKGDERIERSPAPEVVVSECADSSVNLILRFWISDESIERRIGYEYLEKAKKALDAANIQIPFPHMQLFLEQTPAAAALAGGRGEGTRQN
jgi:small conductance mechanosensitive channel